MKYLVIFILILSTQSVEAQYSFFEPAGSFAIEVSLENTKLKRLPIYRNSISSLTVVKDMIIGGTKAGQGLSPFLFAASITSKEMVAITDLASVVGGQRGIVTGFHKYDEALFAGTLPHAGGSGHLIRVEYSPVSGDSIKITDLGTPIQHEGILSLTINPATGMLFGISHPTGLFFSYNLATRRSKTYNDIVPSPQQLVKLKDEFGLTPDDYLCKALVIDNGGMVYGSATINRLFAFNPKTEKFSMLKDSLPEVWGRNVLGQVESWTRARDGTLYGGNAGDGQLFSVNPVTKKVKNVGKPVMANGLRGLAFGNDGRLYGIAGKLPGYSHLFAYSEPNGFKDYGNPQFKMKAPGIEQGIDWRGFQLGTIASSEDGKYIVLGEDESLSQLLVFPVQQSTVSKSRQKK